MKFDRFWQGKGSSSRIFRDLIVDKPTPASASFHAHWLKIWLGDSDAATVMNIYAQYMRHKANAAENDLTQMSESVADPFE